MQGHTAGHGDYPDQKDSAGQRISIVKRYRYAVRKSRRKRSFHHQERESHRYEAAVVELVNEKLVGEGKTEVVVDPIGAGHGEVVLLCKGSSARLVFGGNAPVDTVVVGIVEEVTS